MEEKYIFLVKILISYLCILFIYFDETCLFIYNMIFSIKT
jgi:hypothetical protein